MTFNNLEGFYANWIKESSVTPCAYQSNKSESESIKETKRSVSEPDEARQEVTGNENCEQRGKPKET